MRTQALAKPEVGDFLSKHCVAVYDKVGTFQVNAGPDDKNPNRNGGNVAAFFCTPNGHVIHAVAGPRTAEAFLAEAKWAVTVYSQILSDRSLGVSQARADQVSRVTAALRQAHTNAADLLNKPSQSAPARELVVHEPPSDPKLKGLDDAGRKQRKQVHQLMKSLAFEPLAVVGPKVYTDILGETVTNQPVQLTGANEARQAAGNARNLVEFLSKGSTGRSNDENGNESAPAAQQPSEKPPKKPAGRQRN